MYLLEGADESHESVDGFFEKNLKLTNAGIKSLAAQSAAKRLVSTRALLTTEKCPSGKWFEFTRRIGTKRSLFRLYGLNRADIHDRLDLRLLPLPQWRVPAHLLRASAAVYSLASACPTHGSIYAALAETQMPTRCASELDLLARLSVRRSTDIAAQRCVTPRFQTKESLPALDLRPISSFVIAVLDVMGGRRFQIVPEGGLKVRVVRKIGCWVERRGAALEATIQDVMRCPSIVVGA